MAKVNQPNRVNKQKAFTKRTRMPEEDKIAWIAKAEVVDGYYNLYYCITSVYGQTFYVLKTKGSDVTPGEILDPSRITYVYWVSSTVITCDKPEVNRYTYAK